jgi:hypothetical protein
MVIASLGVVVCVCLTAISFFEPGSVRAFACGGFRGSLEKFFDLVWSSF